MAILNCDIDSGYELGCDFGAGGVAQVYISRFNKNLGVTTSADGVITAITIPPIPPASTSVPTFYTFQQDSGDASLTFNPVNDPANKSLYFQNDAIVRLTGMNFETRNHLLNLARAPLTIIIEDANGQHWLIGLREPARMSAGTAGVGRARGDFQGVEMTFSTQEKVPAYPVDAAALATILV